MIRVFPGTKARYIKTAPLLRLLDAQGVGYRLIDPGQHGALSVGLRDELCLAIITRIERTYHRRRCQRGLGKLPPVEFEEVRGGRWQHGHRRHGITRNPAVNRPLGRLEVRSHDALRGNGARPSPCV